MTSKLKALGGAVQVTACRGRGHIVAAAIQVAKLVDITRNLAVADKLRESFLKMQR